MVTFKPLSDAFGVEVRGFDLENISESDKEKLRQAYLTQGILLLRDQPMTLQQHIAFSQIFGNLKVHPFESLRHREAPEITVLEKTAASDAALAADGTKPDPETDKIAGQLPWHTDLTYTTKPSRGAILLPVEIPPEGGETGWIDTAKVYAALPDSTKRRIAGLKVVHSQMAAQANMGQPSEKKKSSRPQSEVEKLLEDLQEGDVKQKFPDVIHPLVHTHEGTGEAVLNVSPMFARNIVGLPEDESTALLSELQDFATQERFTYVHEWELSDVVVWNNWRTMHRALGCKDRYRRVMHRTTIEGSPLPMSMAA